MNKKFWKLISLLVLLCLVVSFTGGCASTEKKEEAKYPVKPIKVIIPFAAGGGTDVMVRAIMKYIELDGQPLVAVNVEGGGSTIGTMEAYNANPDGYTILCQGPQSMLSLYIVKSVDKPVGEDMIPIATPVHDPDVISVAKNSKFKNIEEMVKYAKENPGQIKWGSVGATGMNYAASAMIWKELGIKVTYVPFDSASKSRTALLGGHIDVLLSQVSEISSVANSGDVIPVLVTTQKRYELIPNCPAMSDIGSKVDFTYYRGFWAPPNTPQYVIDKLEAAFKKVSENPDFQKFMGNDLKYGTTFLGSKETRNMLNEQKPWLSTFLEESLKNKKK